jgi:hypothetical protein
MSERRVQEPDSMDRLMELQSRLRELTEAKKAKWRELGRPLPDGSSSERPDPPHPDAGPVGQNGAGLRASDLPDARAGDAKAPGSEAASPLEPDAVSTPVAASEIAREKVGEQPDTASGAVSAPTDKRFARRRDVSSEWACRASRKLEEAGAYAAAFWRQAVAQVRDLTGGLGARNAKKKPRPGDPITAEELIDDRSLGARLLGAAVFFVGRVAIGAVALVQLGKLQIPWLDDNALPAATATARSVGDAASGASLTEESSGERGADRALESGPDMQASESGSVMDVGAGSSQGASANLEPEPSSEAAGSAAGASETAAREVLEFTRLQGELAFLIGEYEIVRAAFESGEAGCEELNTHYTSIDSTHLLMSRVVARWREVPYRHVKAYEEISGLVDGTLRHYAASGCGLDPAELPGGG